jgi:hypothetical protein
MGGEGVGEGSGQACIMSGQSSQARDYIAKLPLYPLSYLAISQSHAWPNTCLDGAAACQAGVQDALKYSKLHTEDCSSRFQDSVQVAM